MSRAEEWLANEVAAFDPVDQDAAREALRKTTMYQAAVFGDAVRDLGHEICRAIAPKGHNPGDLFTALSMRAHHLGIGFPSPTCSVLNHRRGRRA